MNVQLLIRLLLSLCCLASLPAHAHKPSDSYLTIASSGRQIEGQWDIALRDLEFAIGLDRDGNSEISWQEVRARHRDIAAYALSRLALSSGGRDCPLQANAHLIDQHTDGVYEVLRFSGTCAAQIDALSIRYQLLFDIDPQHRGLLNLQHGGHTQTAIFSPEHPEQRFALSAASGWHSFADYFRDGVHHIWIGFDHILFLLSLLLPAVLLRNNRQWQPAHCFRASLADVLKIVTAFTAAHSITLTLAALQLVSLPSRLVESAIAASVVIAAVNNVLPMFQERRWLAAFGFGLIHGFGFAGVLTDLGLPQSSLLPALVGFNAGVEAGQLAIVAAFLPLAFALRGTLLYRRVLFAGGSGAIAVIATIWLVERAFDMKLPVI